VLADVSVCCWPPWRFLAIATATTTAAHNTIKNKKGFISILYRNKQM